MYRVKVRVRHREQRLHLPLVEQRDGEAEAAKAARAADAVEVGGEGAGRLQVEHEVDPAKVDAACEQVGAYEHAQLEGVHAPHDGAALLLRVLAAHKGRGEARVAQRTRQARGGVVVVAEDERLVEGQGLGKGKG